MMKYYFLGIIFLFHICIVAEENPFQIEEDFQAIDRADDSLFSTMKNELIKAEVVPESVMIDFKKRTIIKKEVKSIINPPLHKKNIHKKIKNRKKIEKKVKLLHKKSVYKKREKRRKLKLLKKQERLRKYYERNIANIDLVKEKQMKKEKLNRDYHKAVKDVDAF